MKSFIACAKTAAFTIVVGFVAIKFLTLMWAAALFTEQFNVMYLGIMWLSYIATAVIALTAGLIGPYFDRQHPMITSAFAAGLVELMSESVGAGLAEHPLRTVLWTLAAAGIAAAIAWWRSRRAQLAPPQEITAPE